jgi:hypothetical protein
MEMTHVSVLVPKLIVPKKVLTIQSCHCPKAPNKHQLVTCIAPNCLTKLRPCVSLFLLFFFFFSFFSFFWWWKPVGTSLCFLSLFFLPFLRATDEVSAASTYTEMRALSATVPFLFVMPFRLVGSLVILKLVRIINLS